MSDIFGINGIPPLCLHFTITGSINKAALFYISENVPLFLNLFLRIYFMDPHEGFPVLHQLADMLFSHLLLNLEQAFLVLPS